MKPNKEEKYHTRLTAGGDRINYPDDVGTPTADMTLFKCLMNSIISTPGAQCIMVDIKDFYLCIPMKCSDHERVPITRVSDSERIRVLQNNKRNVWPTSIWNHSTRITHRETSGIWLPSKQDHNETVDR